MRLYLNSLQADLLKKHIGPFLFCFFTLMFLLLMQFLILNIDKLVGKGLPFMVIIELILTNLAYMVVLAGPMAVLVSTLMAFGKFSELNELTALRASGVSPLRMMMPVIIASLLLAAFLAYFSNNILPESNHKARSLFIDIRLKKPGFDLKENIYYDGINGYTFLVKRIDSETDSLYDVTLYQEPVSNRNRAIIRAEKGYLKSESPVLLTLYLFNGNSTTFHGRSRDGSELIEKSTFSDYRISFDLSNLSFNRSNPKERSRSDRTMRAQAMMVVVDSLQTEINEEWDKLSIDRSVFVYDEGFMRDNSSAITLSEAQEKDKKDAIKEELLATEYYAARVLGDADESRRTLNNAKDELRSYKMSVDKTLSNIEWRQKRISKYLVEVHKKLAIPFACVVFVLLGAPIGIMTRRGNLGIAALISALILTIYWVSLIQGEKLADRLYISPFVGMWFFNIVFTIIGIMLIIRLNTNFNLRRLFRRS